MNKFVNFKIQSKFSNMKLLYLLIGFLSLPYALNAQFKDQSTDSVEVISQFKNLYRYQNYYLGGQPSYEALQWLRTKEVGTIVNLRSDKENSEFTASSFNEKDLAGQLGIKYYEIPVDGIKDYTPEKLQELTALMGGNESVLIHCAGAGRVTWFFMAYLVKSKGYSIDQAITIGKKLTFSFPLENLLDTRISMEAVR
jgi:protein tyrosine phosphatase (PTP) superfamily phosphohydrolase (DUF442 family)